LENKQIADSNTMDYIILVVLFKGISIDEYDRLQDGPLKNNPFLEILQLNKLPEKMGHSVLLNNYIDYSLLFDKSKQPYKHKINKR
jgi:hypothetical protein